MIRPNKKKNWLASHSHKFLEAGGRFFIFTLTTFLIVLFWGVGGWVWFSAISVIVFSIDVAKAAILI